MSKRIKTKGHYRYVERDEKGRFIKAEKWSSAKADRCPRCKHYTLEEAGYLESVDAIATYCKRCGFRGFKHPISENTTKGDNSA